MTDIRIILTAVALWTAAAVGIAPAVCSAVPPPSQVVSSVADGSNPDSTAGSPVSSAAEPDASDDFAIDPRILSAVETYGPFAVLFLLVMPLMGEDVIIIPAGFLIGQGHLPWLLTFICAYIGAFISDSMWYFICYRYGTPLLHKKWFKRLAHPRRLLQAKHQIETRGAWLIVTSRFVPGSRTSTMIVSGLMHMPVWKFVLAEGVMLVLTIAMQLGLGYLVSQHIVASKGGAATIMSIIGLIMLLIVAAVVMNWWTSSRAPGSTRAPRSKVTWLKRFRVKRPLLSAKSPARARALAASAPLAAASSTSEPVDTGRSSRER